ncbi:MAG: WXG100 family type VII secretion target [Jatrophihabitans sp.]
MTLGDPDRLEQVAHHLEGHADQLRVAASRLAQASAATRWHSPAATQYRARVEHLLDRVTRSAHDVDHAAAVLRHHARNVRRMRHVLDAARKALGVHKVVGRFPPGVLGPAGSR